MSVAVFTFTYNEAINLPIWIRYFGCLFGEENLFVADRSSNDGSTAILGLVNKVNLPHGPFDEHAKTGFVNLFHRALLHHYDTVIYTDADELIVPDLNRHANLAEYINNTEFDYVTCVGLNVQHMINQEAPLDPLAPVLAQRRFARFSSSCCKSLISRVPINWQPGIHSCDKPPKIDPSLYMFHLKFMDYSVAMNRQRINQDTVWSSRGIEQKHGAHHRYDFDRFVRKSFLDPINILKNKGLDPFDFTQQIAEINSRVRTEKDAFHIPMNIYSLVELPERLRNAF